jgi:uncharacterized protein YbcI
MHETDAGKGLRIAINDLVVRTLHRYTGRGAVRSRTVMGDDTVMVLLEDTLTRGEHTLLEHGRADEVLRLRRTYQEVMGEELSAGIAELTGRPVLAFLSANHADPDYAAEIFVLGNPGEQDTAADGTATAGDVVESGGPVDPRADADAVADPAA